MLYHRPLLSDIGHSARETEYHDMHVHRKSSHRFCSVVGRLSTNFSDNQSPYIRRVKVMILFADVPTSL